MANDRDNEYLDRILAGDTDAFSEIVGRYSGIVFSLIVRVCGGREDAEELTQDTFMKAYENLHKFHRKSSFSTWIYRIAYNTAISHVRRKKHEKPTDDFNKMELSASPDFSSGESEAGIFERKVSALEDAMALLPSEDRALLLLFYKDDLSLSEIGRIMSISENNAKTRLYRIRKKLAGLYGETPDT